MALKILILLVLVAGSSPLAAQQIYKCSDGKGGNIYQQSECPKNSATKSVRRYTPVSDAPRYYGGNSESSNFSFQGSQPGTATRQTGRSRGSTLGVIGSPNSPNMQDKLRSIATDPAYKGSPSARRAAMNAAMQESGYAPLPAYQAPKAGGIGQPVNVIDQQTGMPINGAVKVAPNMIWDPATGRYLQTN